MNKMISKTLMACAVSAVCAFSANIATAQTTTGNNLPNFVFNAPGTVIPNFSADQLTGKYLEIANFGADGSFDVSLYWKAAAFVANDGKSQLDSKVTGLTGSYGLYALYTASGTYVTTGTRTDFTFAAGTGDLSLYLDPNQDTVYDAVEGPTGGFIISNPTADILLATGEPQYGVGFVNPALETCPSNAGNYCGSFGSRTTFELTEAGSTYFVEPSPFYQLSFQSGQVNNFQPSGRQVVNGSLDVSFNDVPEPASIALLGLGLLGLGLSRRRKQA